MQHLRFPPRHLLSPAITLLLLRSSHPLPPLLHSPLIPPASVSRPPSRDLSSGRKGSHTTDQTKRGRLRLDHPSSAADLGEVVQIVREDGDGLEAQLNQMDLRISQSYVLNILCVLNHERIPALRFFNWAVSSRPGFVPSSKIYNQIVNNLGTVDDYDSMVSLLTELSHRGFCLTEKAFVFLTRGNYDNLASSVDKIVNVLNGVRSCRNSGIFSLIRHLCSMNAFDLAISIMEKTSRRTRRYYNALIAAKCRNGDFQGAREVLDEMPDSNCDPDMNSFNYILSCLLKFNRENEACGLLEVMERSGFKPDPLTYELLVFHVCNSGKIDLAVQFLDRMILEGLRPRIQTHAAFIKGYFALGREIDACNYVRNMIVRDKFSVNVNYGMLSTLFCKRKRMLEAGRVLHEMMEKGFRPAWNVYVRVAKMLIKAGRGDMASQLKNMFLKFES